MDLNSSINNDNNNENLDIETNIQIKKYNYEQKMNLVNKINKIKKTEYLINIFKIVKLFSDSYIINNNGIFILFNNLNNEAYEKIESYLNEIYKMHKKQINLETSDFECSDNKLIKSILSDTIEFENEKNLSNKEKLIMRRKKYEKYLTQNQNQNN